MPPSVWMRSVLAVATGFSGCSGGDEKPESQVQSAVAPAVAQATRLNAADEYARISAQLGESVIEKLQNVGGWGSVDGSAAQVLSANQPAVEQLLRATRMEHCDFHVDIRTTNQPLAHGRMVRNFVRILNADALRMGASGGIGAAPGERVAAMVCLSRQMAQDDLLVCKLMGIACINLAVRTAGELADHRVVNDAGRQAMLKEFRDFEHRARLDAPEVIAHEREAAVTALRGGDARYLALTGAEKLDQAGREVVAGEVERALQQLERVWNAPNGLAEARKIGSQLANPVTKAFVSALIKGREQIDKAKADIHATIAKLETR